MLRLRLGAKWKPPVAKVLLKYLQKVRSFLETLGVGFNVENNADESRRKTLLFLFQSQC